MKPDLEAIRARADGAEYQKKRREQRPWVTALTGAKQRCINPKNPKYKYYGGRGIKFLLTEDDVIFLWIRDRAYSLGWPSLDRIDNNGNYEISNCQFIEMGENSKKGRAYRYVCGVVGCERIHRAKGLCHAHYQRKDRELLLAALAAVGEK